MLSIGAACTTNASCNSGFCAQGVCCNTACAGLCTACNLTTPSSVGTCIDVPGGGNDPTARCTAASMASCGLDGFCDGNGACQKWASGTQCIAQTCTTSTLHPMSTCNGTGTCVSPATSSCTPFICGTNACKTTCATNADCISAAYMCSGGSCIQAVNITVGLKEPTSSPATNPWIYFDLQITNNGTTTIPYSQLTVRYWYTWEDTGTVAQTAQCTFANNVGGGAPSVLVGSGAPYFVAVSPAKTGADYYFQFGFTTAAGNLGIGAGSAATMEVGFHKNDFTNYVQTGDYSFNAAANYTTTTNVTVYLGGALVYGVEPM